MIVTIATLESVRGALRSKWTMAALCDAMPTVPRDVMVEIIDALHRHPSLHDCQRHVNQVLAYQEAGVPLVNGRPR